MSKSGLKTIHFQGILLRKAPAAPSENVHLYFQTRSGPRAIVAHNPILIPRLQIGVTYNIKGHERGADDELYIRLMSAWPVLEPESVFAGQGKRVLGAVSAALIVGFSIFSFIPAAEPLAGTDTKSHADAVSEESNGAFQEPLLDIKWISPVISQVGASQKLAEPAPPPVTNVVSSSEQPPALPAGEIASEQITQPATIVLPGESQDPQLNEASPSNAGATDVQPSATLQPADSSLRPSLEPASST